LTNSSDEMSVLEYDLPDDELLESNAYSPSRSIRDPGCFFIPANRSTDANDDIGPSARPYVHRIDDRQALVYCSGFYGNNSDPDATSRGGYAIVGSSCKISFLLEEKGPDRNPHVQTEDRAHIRAIVAALNGKWDYDRWDSIIIATDSETIARCGSRLLGPWIRNGWKAGPGVLAEDWDLWDLVVSKMLELRLHHDIKVWFWHIPTEYNLAAISAAENATGRPDPTPCNFPRVFKKLMPS
jgi:ribonuclease HI